MTALRYVAPVGETEEHLARAIHAIGSYLPPEKSHAASEDLRIA